MQDVPLEFWSLCSEDYCIPLRMCGELISYLPFVKAFTTYFVYLCYYRFIYCCLGKVHEAAGSIRRVKGGTMNNCKALLENCKFSRAARAWYWELSHLRSGVPFFRGMEKKEREMHLRSNKKKKKTTSDLRLGIN